MKRTTVKIPDELDRRLRQEAERRGCTISEVTRAALEAELGGPGDPFLEAMIGSASSGRGDLAARMEEVLPGVIETEARRSRS